MNRPNNERGSFRPTVEAARDFVAAPRRRFGPTNRTGTTSKSGAKATLGWGTLLSKIRMEAYLVAEFRIGERPQIEDDGVHQP
jgi:hypothetical protein